MSVSDAVLAAASSRFRPILMTTLAMIFGTLPIARRWELHRVAGLHWVLPWLAV